MFLHTYLLIYQTTYLSAHLPICVSIYVCTYLPVNLPT